MPSLIRFIVHQHIAGERARVGLFTAAYHLRARGELSCHDRQTLEELLGWFRAELTVPPQGVIPSQAIFWYSDGGRFTKRMWELAQILREYGFTVELISSTAVGTRVYSDRDQVAAIPQRPRRR